MVQTGVGVAVSFGGDIYLVGVVVGVGKTNCLVGGTGVKLGVGVGETVAVAVGVKVGVFVITGVFVGILGAVAVSLIGVLLGVMLEVGEGGITFVEVTVGVFVGITGLGTGGLRYIKSPMQTISTNTTANITSILRTRNSPEPFAIF